MSTTIDTIKSAASADAVAYAKGEKAVFDVIDAAARHLGVSPTLGEWDAYREAWIAASPLTAPDKAWERFANLLLSRCGLKKPKAETKKAVAVSATRAAEKAEIDALAQKPKAELAQQAKALLDKGDPEALKRVIMVQKAMKAQSTAEVATAKAAFMDLKKGVRAAVTGLKWNAKNRAILERLQAELNKA
jgi:hypothetical protein